jgi:hypothetical protein
MGSEARGGWDSALGRDPLGRNPLDRDWATIWESELAAAAVDREAQETWRGLLPLLIGPLGARLADAAAGRPGPGPTAGASPAAAAPDARDAAIERLAGRVAELERRMAALERPRRRRAGKPG